MRVHILKDTTTEGLEEKINKLAKENPFATTVIQYQATTIPQFRGKDIVDTKVQYSAMVRLDEFLKN